MAEQFLHATQIQAHFDQVGRVSMAQAVDRHLFPDFAIGNHAGNCAPKTSSTKPLAPCA